MIWLPPKGWANWRWLRSSMQSKNKAPMTTIERKHVDAVKQMPCAVCGQSGPSDAHEIEQGKWFLSIPLCRDDHQGSKNGIHGERLRWKLNKKTELSCLNDTLSKLYGGIR